LKITGSLPVLNNKRYGNEVMSEAVSSVVAIDIGTHKVSVLIGKVHAPDKIQVIGMATARNRGMVKGKIVSLDKVIAAIKNAVSEAEDMAECRIHSAWVSIPRYF
jgi:cell division protein FtsA